MPACPGPCLLLLLVLVPARAAAAAAPAAGADAGAAPCVVLLAGACGAVRVGGCWLAGLLQGLGLLDGAVLVLVRSERGTPSGQQLRRCSPPTSCWGTHTSCCCCCTPGFCCCCWWCCCVRSTVGWLDGTGTVVVVAAAEGMSSILAAAAAVLWPGVSGPDAAARCCVSVLGVGEGCC